MLKKIARFGIPVLIISCLAIFCIYIGYRIAVGYDYDKCFVQKNEVIDAEIKSTLSEGMSRSQVMDTLNSFGKVQVLDSVDTADNIRLGMCKFYENSFYFRISYAENGDYIKIIRYMESD